MLKIIKKHKVISCISVYILLWFSFGIAYYIIANVSEGEMFHFQNDILLKTKVVAFQKELGIETSYEITKALFVEETDISRMKISEGEYPMLTYNLTNYGLKAIGMNWAKFYYSQWAHQNYNYYKLDIEEEHQRLIGSNEFYIIKLTVCDIPDSSITKIKPNQATILTDLNVINIEKQKEYLITIDETLLKNYQFNQYYPLYHNLYPISQSVNYLDNTIDLVYDYQVNEKFRYSFIDFLYFSAVTISTLGYGDILPNATCIRLLVMIQTLVGSIILAIFISLFYDYIKNSKLRMQK